MPPKKKQKRAPSKAAAKKAAKAAAKAAKKARDSPEAIAVAKREWCAKADACIIGVFRIKVAQLHQAPENLRIRSIHPKGVDSLIARIIKWDEDSVISVIEDEGALGPGVQSLAEIFAKEERRLTLDDVTAWDSRRFFYIAGNHRLGAVTDINKCGRRPERRPVS